MSVVGHCGDNAACKGFFGVLKRERIHHRRYRTLNKARADVFDYVKRLHNPRMRCRVATQDLKLSAVLKPSVKTGENRCHTNLKIMAFSRLTLSQGEATMSQNRIDLKTLRTEAVMEAIALFEGDRKAAAHWLATPVRGLGHRKPNDLLVTREGIQQVRDIIGRLKHGVFS